MLFNRVRGVIKSCILENLYFYYKKFEKMAIFLCLFFFSLTDFYLEIFFYNAFLLKSVLCKVFLIGNLKTQFMFKFINLNFFRNINNYYSSDFFLKNSKIMSLCALKTYPLN
jgi:hypothetical protein